jgi:hypothetical protein
MVPAMRNHSPHVPWLVLVLGSNWLAACSDDVASLANELPDAAASSSTPNASTATTSDHELEDTNGTETSQRLPPTNASSAASLSSEAGASNVATSDGGSAANATTATAEDDTSLPNVSSSNAESSTPRFTSDARVDASAGTETGTELPTMEAGDGGIEGVFGDAGAAPRARLVVADPEAYAIYIYDIPSLELVGRYDGAHFAEHAGFFPLDDGRVLFVDDQSSTLNIHDVFGPIPGDMQMLASLSGSPLHLAVDPSQRYAATSAMALDFGVDTINLTDMRSPNWTTVKAEIPTGEPGVLLGGDPLLLYHRNDDPPTMELYDFETLWNGQQSLLSGKTLGTGPHGEAIAHAAGKLFSAADEGFYVMDASGSSLSEPRIVPYAASGREGGRAYYSRMGSNQKFIYTYLRNNGDQPWRDWQNDAYILDVNTETATRIEIGDGLVYRLAESSRYAIYAQYHPDGDFAHFLDTDPTSETFHTLVGRVPLPAMSKTPTGEDASPWESEAFRLTGILPSGDYAFVTHGGDGEISVIDTSSMTIVGTIETPTPLDFGGYLLGMEEGAHASDTLGR